MTTSYDLGRFVVAQEKIYETVRKELEAGEKRSHWMWYIFPQIRGLGGSATSQRYAISSREEARAYLAHPILGPRLIECTKLVICVENRTAEQIFGYPDCLKFRSSMTLFEQSADEPEPFRTALQKYYHGERDALTLQLLQADPA